MSAAEPSAADAASQLKRQIPSYVAVGLIGYCVNAGVTYALARIFGVPPAFARLPAFAVATAVNFCLNRALTFRTSTAPLLGAFVRYVMVCAAGLVVNYAVYLACIAASPFVGVAVTPAILPLFVAAGSGAAMGITFIGFRSFAFRG